MSCNPSMKTNHPDQPAPCRKSQPEAEAMTEDEVAPTLGYLVPENDKEQRQQNTTSLNSMPTSLRPSLLISE